MKQLNIKLYEWNNSIDHCHPKLFGRQLAQPTLSQLRRLTIDVHPRNFDLNKLNCLTRLTQLKIAYEPPKSQNPLKLNLPELRQLEITCNKTRELIVQSTKLEKLTYYGDESLLHVEHPETVLNLDSDLTDERLRSFRNVCHLRSSSNLWILDERTLLDFPNLKEVAYTGSLDDVWEAFELYSLSHLRPQEWEGIYDLSSYLQRFMDKKKALGRTELKVQFVSFELVDHKAIEYYRFDDFYEHYDYDYNRENPGSSEWLCLHANNYDQLMGTFHFSDLDYTNLMEAFHQRLPDDLFSKFLGIRSVDVRESQVDEEHLLWMLQSVPELEKLSLSVKILSECFFRRLAESCSKSLRSMKLYTNPMESLQNLDFASEFKALNFLLIYTNRSPSPIRWLLNMSWPNKRQFNLAFFGHWHPNRQQLLEYGVMSLLGGEEAFLYQGNSEFMDSKNFVRLKSCSLTCLGELADEFERLQANGSIL